MAARWAPYILSRMGLSKLADLLLVVGTLHMQVGLPPTPAPS